MVATCRVEVRALVFALCLVPVGGRPAYAQPNDAPQADSAVPAEETPTEDSKNDEPAEAPPPASEGAQEAERAALLAQMVEAHQAGQHDTALSLARRVFAIRATASVQRFIAEQHWLLGERTPALQAARLCLELVAAEPESDNRQAIETGCRFIADSARGTLNGAEAAPTPEPVSGGGDATSEATPTSDAAPAAVVKPLATEPAVAPSVPPDTTLAPTAAVDAGAETTSIPSWLPTALMGVGVVTLGAAASTYALSSNKHGSLKKRCPDGCQDSEAERTEAARDKRAIQKLDRLAWGLLAGGVLAGGSGLTLWFTTRPSGDRATFRVGVSGSF